MYIKISLLLILAAMLVVLAWCLYIRKYIRIKSAAIMSVCFMLLISAVGTYMFLTDNAHYQSEKERAVVSRSEDNRVMDMIMWYDIDIGPSNARPLNGWWTLNPNHPDTVNIGGCYRATTSVLGLYDLGDSDVSRQHLYWMSALGCNGVAVDWTNYTSYRDLTVNNVAYNTGVYCNTEVLLKTAKNEKDFDTPGVYVTVRLSGTNFKKLKETIDDVYALYEKYSEAWYYFDDGTKNADKPFLVIFTDWDIIDAYIMQDDVLYEDDRFNIRFSNGFLSSRASLEKDGTRSIAGNIPLWLFIENEMDDSAGEGMYRTFHKDGPDGKVEQMIAWASVYKGGTKWDGLNNIINNQTTFERTLRNVDELSPKALLICRFNYPVVWLEEPQEGVSLYGSTHIEPNKDFGFLVFDNVRKNLYRLNYWEEKAPGGATINNISDNAIFLDFDEYITEYRISVLSGEMGDWEYYNINSGIEILDEWIGNTIYIQTRNSFGESTVTEYTLNVD